MKFCESSFFTELKTEKGQALTPSALTGIRAAIHRHLTRAPLSRNINILQDSEFMSASKMFEAKAKLFMKENNAKPKHKSSIQSGDVQKLNRYFMEGQNTDGVWKDAENSPADWCKNCGIYGKSTKFCTKIENYLLNNISYGPTWDLSHNCNYNGLKVAHYSSQFAS